MQKIDFIHKMEVKEYCYFNNTRLQNQSRNYHRKQPEEFKKQKGRICKEQVQ